MSEESRLGRELLLKVIRVELRNLHWSEADPDLVLNHEGGEPFHIDEDDEYALRRALSYCGENHLSVGGVLPVNLQSDGRDGVVR